MSISAIVEELNAAGVHDNFLSVGGYLARSKWAPLVEGRNPIEDPNTRYATAVMLENTERYIKSMDETVRAVSIGDFQKYAFPLVRAIFPELVTNELVSVQPMLGPVSLVFYMDFVYGSNKGKVRRGDTAFSSVARGPSNPSYSSPQIDEESRSFTLGANNAGGTLDYAPVQPGSLVITDGVQTVTDDGAGGFTGDIGAGTSTIEYSSGTITSSATFFAVTPSGPVTASYTYDMEANPKIPRMGLVLQSSPVSARPRKLATDWSLEAAFNMKALHGMEAEVEMTSAVGADIRFEIDREIILDLQRMAGAGSGYWNKTNNAAVSFTEHKLSAIDTMTKVSNQIWKTTGRGRATWIVCGEAVASVLETLPGFIGNPGLASGLQKGVYKAGRLNTQWDVFKDPFYPDDFFVMGFKGQSFLEAGFVYAPYIPLYTTPTVVLDDFIARKGLATQYGKKAVNPLFYATGEFNTAASLLARSGAASEATVPTHGVGGRGVYGI